MKMVRLYNTLSRREEEFRSIKPKEAKVYVCGVTPYDSAHIGHGRCYVVFDVLVRVLKVLGYKVEYVRNFTDIDDKILKKAKEEGIHYKEIADRYISEFKRDMKALGCLEPSVEPRVTENIDEIVQFINGLVEDDVAYVLDNDVYFDIKKFSDYGKLSGKKLEDLISGLRVKAEGKKNPGDFALWKSAEGFWNSPWGSGRPGWHIECSVMAKKFLGKTIDIHGGGMDLMFPHHENEIAQSECLNKSKLANYWIHNALVNINKEKMSKSIGNIFKLEKIYELYNPMVLRYYYLQHHYRAPMDFKLENLDAVGKAYNKLVDVFSDVPIKKEYSSNALIDNMLDALCDDLNTSKLLGIIFENLQDIKSSENKSDIKTFLFKVTGLTFEKVKEELSLEIQSLLDEREVARKNKDWDAADRIRKQLKELGIDTHDKKINS